MSYEATVVRAWQGFHLFSALLELTYRCNLDCSFCYNDMELEGEPLRFSHYELLLEELRELGCLHLALTGGEPLAHPDFFAIGKRARELGFVTRVKSNGHALRGEILRRVQDEVDPFLVEISLHGALARTHDRQTRVSGSFDRLLANLAEMRACHLRVKLKCALTRWNESEIEGMFAIADRFEMPLVIDPEITPRDNGDLEPLQLTATPEGLKHLVAVQSQRALAARAEIAREGDDGVAAHAPDSGRHCGAGAAGIAVDPYGNVYPCVQWRRPIGNLHQSRLADIWKDNTRLDEIRRLTVEAKSMLGDGEEVPLLGFCPGIAESLTGDPLVVPKAASERAAILAEALLPLHPSSRLSTSPAVSHGPSVSIKSTT